MRLLVVLLSSVVLLTSCAVVHSDFTRELEVGTLTKTNAKQIAVFSQKPSRAALKIGMVSTDGNRSSGSDDLVKEAKKIAAELGGDFIVVEDSGVESTTVYSPGYAKYKARGNTSCTDYFRSKYDSEDYCFVESSIRTIHCPWAKYSVWVYTPSQLGVRLDENNHVVSFHLNSDAEKAGVNVGDKLIGIDGYDVLDERSFHHLMDVYSGDKVQLALQRDSERIDCVITALPN